jgi:ABC-type Fe3+-siderophore transport system permease subunit
LVAHNLEIEMTKRKSDIIAGISLFAFSGVLYIGAGFMPTRSEGSKILNTGFYPRMLAIILAILSVILVIETIQKYKKEGDKESEVFWKNSKSFFFFATTLVLLTLFPFVMKVLGFALTSFLFIAIMVWLLSEKNNRHPLKIVLVSVGIAAIVYVVFKIILAIPFPTGILL